MALFPVSLLNKFGSLCLSHLLAAVLLVGFLPSTACAEAATPIRIDASAPATEPSQAAYDGGAATSPTQGTLGLNSRYLTLNGKPWLPAMGEFHFSRYPRDQWENEILKMKAAGVNIVAAYVIWIHHEEIEGQSDWTGQRDLRAFAQICAKHHMYTTVPTSRFGHGRLFASRILDSSVARSIQRSTSVFMTS